jgi:UDP:flavonoid glycosyltransferase YjiC (YdhE family)
LLKEGTFAATVDESEFDLVLVPGELGAVKRESLLAGGGLRLLIPPVCLLGSDEMLDRAAARKALGLSADGRHALFSLGSGNLKDVTEIGQGLIKILKAEGFNVAWAQPPISVHDVKLPLGVASLPIYPLARYLRAFDVFVGAAGYNTCYEVMQAGVPALFVPNMQLVDDQTRRARLVAELAPAVVSACETDRERINAVRALLAKSVNKGAMQGTMPMNGASIAAEEILALALAKRRMN